ncbi:MAG: response regulator [Synechococcales cyanobacterium RU_4_20]|nr:response regulator [Synechococcales cyanobacterium RU_4_20]
MKNLARTIDKEEGIALRAVRQDINHAKRQWSQEFLRRLKETAHSATPVIMVTTEGGEKTVLEAIQLGAKGFIKKPFTPAQLEAAPGQGAAR